MHNAYLLLARLEASGVTARLGANGRVQLRPKDKLSNQLLVEAREHRDAIADLLRLRLSEPRRMIEDAEL